MKTDWGWGGGSLIFSDWHYKSHFNHTSCGACIESLLFSATRGSQWEV